MAEIRKLAFLILAIVGATLAAEAAELPAEAKKAKPPETARKCNIGGMPGVVAANGVCVRLSGSVSAGVSAGQVK